MLWIGSIFGSVLTHNCTLLLRFYDGFFSSAIWLNDFDPFFNSWSVYPNFVYHECIYQHRRLSTQIYVNVFISNYQVNLGGRILQLGKKSSCEEYAPHTAKYILGAYSSQYPKIVLYFNLCEYAVRTKN